MEDNFVKRLIEKNRESIEILEHKSKEMMLHFSGSSQIFNNLMEIRKHIDPAIELHLQFCRNPGDNEIRNKFFESMSLNFHYCIHLEKLNNFILQSSHAFLNVPPPVFGPLPENRVFGKNEQSAGSHGRPEETGTSSRITVESETSFGKNEEPGSLSGKTEEQGSLPGKNEEPGSLSGKTEEQGSLPGKNEESGPSYTRNEEHGSLPGRTEEQGRSSVRTDIPSDEATQQFDRFLKLKNQISNHLLNSRKRSADQLDGNDESHSSHGVQEKKARLFEMDDIIIPTIFILLDLFSKFFSISMPSLLEFSSSISSSLSTDSSDSSVSSENKGNI